MRCFLFCILFSLTVRVAAQNIYQSPYSIYDLGLINDRMSTLNRGMAGAGIGLRDQYNLNYKNPASLGSIMSPVSSIFEIGFYMERNNNRTNNLSETGSTGSLSSINYWFKLAPRWASTLGLTPFSSVSYKIKTTRNLGGFSDVDYQYEGSGTISRLYWGNGFNVTKNLSIGVNLSYLFGSISKSESLYISSQSSVLVFENTIFTNKTNIDVGLQYSIPLKKNASVVIGLIAEKDLTFKASQKSYLYDGSLDTLNSSTGDRLRFAIPANFGVGVALHTKKHSIASDLEFENWNSISQKDGDAIYHDTWKFSLGYMYTGNPDANSYLGSISFRAGFHVRQYHLQVKENILKLGGMTMGISMPMFDNRSSINLTYAFNQFGTTKDGLIRQQSQQIMVDVIVRDVWGIKRKFD